MLEITIIIFRSSRVNLFITIFCSRCLFILWLFFSTLFAFSTPYYFPYYLDTPLSSLLPSPLCLFLLFLSFFSSFPSLYFLLLFISFFSLFPSSLHFLLLFSLFPSSLLFISFFCISSPLFFVYDSHLSIIHFSYFHRLSEGNYPYPPVWQYSNGHGSDEAYSDTQNYCWK